MKKIPKVDLCQQVGLLPGNHSEGNKSSPEPYPIFCVSSLSSTTFMISRIRSFFKQSGVDNERGLKKLKRNDSTRTIQKRKKKKTERKKKWSNKVIALHLCSYYHKSYSNEGDIYN